MKHRIEAIDALKATTRVRVRAYRCRAAIPSIDPFPTVVAAWSALAHSSRRSS